MSTPLVSVNVPVYNHERYVERCLRSIAAQETDFDFEVLVGEDCSTDGSRAVLMRLEKELPDNFVFLYREHNLGGKGEGNGSDLLFRSKGRYLAVLEGDDFWTFDGKLQAQVDFLEKNPDYEAVFHRCEVVGEDSAPSGEKYPECRSEDYSFKEYFYCSLPGQLGTSLIRREPYIEARRRFQEKRCYEDYAGDRRYAFLLLSIGKVRCLPDTWSAYRHVSASGTSFSASVTIDDDYAKNEVGFGKTLVSYATSYGPPEAMKAARLTYYRTYLKWSHGPVCPYSLRMCLSEIMHQPDWLPLLLATPRWYVVLGLRQLLGRGVTL